MKILPFVAAGALALFTALPSAAQTAVARQPVIVELFTSEGCSSCPPADLLLQKFVQQQPVAGAEIIALEEHVDYWNHDGWIDPYSSPEWTQRQETYAQLFRKDPYTPEVVVDGRSQCLGSSPKDVGLGIQDAARSAKTEIVVTPGQDAKGSQRFTVTVGKLVGNAAGDTPEIWLALTEDGLQSSVAAGENNGRTLTHISTLRTLHKIGVADLNAAQSFKAEPVVKLNSHWDAANIRITVFVQEKKSHGILGAASIKLKG